MPPISYETFIFGLLNGGIVVSSLVVPGREICPYIFAVLGYYSRADEEVMEITSQVVVHYKSLRVKCNGFSTSGRKSNPKKIIE